MDFRSDLERRRCVYECHLGSLASCFLKSSCNIVCVLRSYRMGKCVTNAHKINDADSFELLIVELSAVSKSEIPLGAERTLCQNVMNALGEVPRGTSIRVNLFLFLWRYYLPYL